MADFEQVTQNFGEVIECINNRFETDFKVFEYAEENLTKVFQIVEEMDKQDTGLRGVQEESIARPSRKRERLKMLMQDKLKESGNSYLPREEQDLYKTFTLGQCQMCSSEGKG